MYNNKVAVAIKAAGKVLREQNETVAIPFGSEFSVFIKNLNSVRALVKVEIDGVDIGDGTRFVVEPNSSVDLERYIKAGNLTSGNKFKFIERTGKIEGTRGIKIDDGLVRVEFQFEKVQPKPSYEDEMWKTIKKLESEVEDYKWRRPYYPYWYTHRPYGYPFYGDSQIFCSSSNVMGTGVATQNIANSGNISESNSASLTSTGENLNNTTYDAKLSSSILRSAFTAQIKPQSLVVENEAGITVPGSVSNQQFQNGSWFATETETHSIVLKIVGKTAKGDVKTPITVKSTQKCSTCNHNNKMTSKFCVECGTSLIII